MAKRKSPFYAGVGRTDLAPVWWTPLERRGWCPWKSQRSGGLAAGTNFAPNKSGSTVFQVTKTEYLWDPRN